MRYFIIVEECRQDRTPSGRWSSVEYNKKRFAWTRTEFENATDEDTRRFFDARITRAYTKVGYIPRRWTAPVAWSNETRQVQVYTPVVIQYEALGHREEWILDNAASIELKEDGGHNLAVITSSLDIDGAAHTCTYDLDAKRFVG